MNDLTETMGNVSLSYQSEELEQLLFRPQQGSGLAQTALDDIPRYLFRVVCPHSVGETNEAWVRSEAASKNEDSSMEDIFFNLDNDKRRTVARMLNQHIRWWPKDGSSDNFVSWSSSLLSSLQYIYYRHLSSKTGLSIEHIDLYVIDTTLFSTGTFIRDLDLIHTFWESDDHPPRQNLENLQYLRNETKYYFGEYLSQGPLKVEGKCEIIPAQSLFTNDRLRRLQPHFKFYNEPFRNEKPEWAKEVIRLRGAIWPTSGTPILSSVEMRDRLQAIKEIIETLSFNWRFPLAIYFAALVRSESTTKNQRTAADDAFFQYFQSDFLTCGSTSIGYDKSPNMTKITNNIQMDKNCYDLQTSMLSHQRQCLKWSKSKVLFVKYTSIWRWDKRWVSAFTIIPCPNTLFISLTWNTRSHKCGRSKYSQLTPR